MLLTFKKLSFVVVFPTKKKKKVMAENIISGNLTDESDGVTVSFDCTAFNKLMGAIMKRKKKY